jgi:hypothetical protein
VTCLMIENEPKIAPMVRPTPAVQVQHVSRILRVGADGI